MLTEVNPKLPMRNKEKTKAYYLSLGFREFGNGNHDEYLMVQKDNVQLHFFEFKELQPEDNYGQVYIRTNTIDQVYKEMIDKNLAIHPNGKLQTKPWGQKEFSMLDPDNNLLTFGQAIG